MARLILLAVKDNEVAEQFVKDLWHLQEIRHTDVSVDSREFMELGVLVAAYTNVEWMIARPMNHCRCTGHGKNRQWGWTKTRRFGWWVHANCNRVSRLVMLNFVTNLLNGHNDILPELRVVEELQQQEEETV